MSAEAPLEKRPRVAAAPRQKVIIDTDPGVDDTWALCLALASEELDIVGLTIVAGNSSDVEQLARNACAVCHLAGRDDIPVVKGADKCLSGVQKGYPGTLVHGKNGLGDVELPAHALSTKGLDHNYASAADFLVEKCAGAPGEIVLVTLGPLTNIALAMRKSADFAGSVQKLVMMGGDAAGGQGGFKFGNKSPAAEANVYNDPEAAKMVFADFPRIVMAGLNVTGQLDCCKWRDRLKTVNEAGRLLHAISHNYVSFLLERPERPIGVHDSTAMLAVLRPQLFPEKRTVFVDVETKGELTSGMTVMDWRGQLKKTAQTTVLLKIDADAALDFFCERVARLDFPDLGNLEPGARGGL